MALEKELETYARELQTLLANEGEGKFVLIQDDKVINVFGTYEDALKQGYKTFGVETPFLVKQISGVEQVQCFTRDIGASAPSDPILING
jgi:hypothetical protein